MDDSSSGSCSSRATIKGGVAIELRLHPTPRATDDIDIIILAPVGSVVDVFDQLIGDPAGGRRLNEGFSFSRKGKPKPLLNDTMRVEVGVEYLGRAWTTISADLAPAEGPDLPLEEVPAIDFVPLGLRGPSSIKVLALEIQYAQKLHGMTRPPAMDGLRNERVRDLADVLLLEEQLPDLRRLKAGCITVFTHRATHPWPPTVEVHEHWRSEYATLAQKYSLKHVALEDATAHARGIIARIDAATSS